MPSVPYFNKKLIDSVRDNDLFGVNKAIKRGADVNIKKGEAMKLAIRNNNIPILIFLIGAGGKLNDDLLVLASVKSLSDIARLLIFDFDIPPDIVAYECATKLGHTDIVEMMNKYIEIKKKCHKIIIDEYTEH